MALVILISDGDILIIGVTVILDGAIPTMVLDFQHLDGATHITLMDILIMAILITVTITPTATTLTMLEEEDLQIIIPIQPLQIETTVPEHIHKTERIQIETQMM